MPPIREPNLPSLPRSNIIIPIIHVHPQDSTARRLGCRLLWVIVLGQMTSSPTDTAVVTLRPLNIEVNANLQPPSAVDEPPTPPPPPSVPLRSN